MSLPVLEVLDPGFGATIQDQGRAGWRRFGVPSSGALDSHAAQWANRLLDNSPDAPLLELLWQGAKLSVLHDCWLAVTGADAHANIPTWRAVHMRAGEIVQFKANRSGVWIYLAIEGGFAARRWLGSASVYQRGGIGLRLAKGEILDRCTARSFQLLPGVAGRVAAREEQRHYDVPPVLRVWRGPQWNSFSEADQRAFSDEPWTIMPQSDRVGYRLMGKSLEANPAEIISEPVRVGSIQIPENGLPIVLMRDGPTVGGYPKIAMVIPEHLCWLAQCRPGQSVRFEFIT